MRTDAAWTDQQMRTRSRHCAYTCDSCCMADLSLASSRKARVTVVEWRMRRPTSETQANWKAKMKSLAGHVETTGSGQPVAAISGCQQVLRAALGRNQGEEHLARIDWEVPRYG